LIQVTAQTRILVAIEAVDFRCGIDRLARVCRERLQAAPFQGAVFVFRNRAQNAVKLVCFDGQGRWLCHKAARNTRSTTQFGVGHQRAARASCSVPPPRIAYCWPSSGKPDWGTPCCHPFTRRASFTNALALMKGAEPGFKACSDPSQSTTLVDVRRQRHSDGMEGPERINPLVAQFKNPRASNQSYDSVCGKK